MTFEPSCPLRQYSRVQQQRRGATIVLMACFMVVFVAMVAFALDIGYICSVQAELQNAADAAALAGARQAMLAVVTPDANSSTVASTTISSAQQAAQQIGGSNPAGSVSLQVPTSDVIVGYEATPGTQDVQPWSSGQPLPNCVQVTTRRDDTANGSLQLIFGRVLGTSYSSLSATATACFEPGRYSITGFNGNNCKLLPITISIETWTEFLTTGVSPDGTRHDDYAIDTGSASPPPKPPANVSGGKDNKPELVGVYPSKLRPGDYGLIQFNPNVSQGTTVSSNWILNGPSASDLSCFGPNGLQATPSSPQTLGAGTGWKSSLIEDFASIVGQSRVIPLYSTCSGSGGTGQFTIVGFAGVTVTSATGAGTNVSIALEPTAVVDPSATSTTGSTSITQFVYPRAPVFLVR